MIEAKFSDAPKTRGKPKRGVSAPGFGLRGLVQRFRVFERWGSQGGVMGEALGLRIFGCA